MKRGSQRTEAKVICIPYQGRRVIIVFFLSHKFLSHLIYASMMFGFPNEMQISNYATSLVLCLFICFPSPRGLFFIVFLKTV